MDKKHMYPKITSLRNTCSSRVTSFPTTASCYNERIVNGLRTIPFYYNNGLILEKCIATPLIYIWIILIKEGDVNDEEKVL